MFKARNYIKKNTLINLYHSYIYSYQIYCIEALGNATNCHLEELYLTQKKVAFSNYNTPGITIFKQLNILPLNTLVLNRIGIKVYSMPIMYYLLQYMICLLQIVMYIIILQGRNTIRVILIYIQKVLVTQVLAYGMLCSPKL